MTDNREELNNVNSVNFLKCFLCTYGVLIFSSWQLNTLLIVILHSQQLSKHKTAHKIKQY